MGKSTLASLVVLTFLTLLVVSTPLPAGKDNIFVPLIDLPKGLAVVYFFKDHSYGKAEHRVYANGKMVGVLTKGTYFPLLVQPGQLSISSNYISDAPPKKIDVVLSIEPGGQYYVKERSGWRTGLLEAEPDAVRKDLPSCVLSTDPLSAVFSQYYQGDLFVSLARVREQAGEREAVTEALRVAKQNYSSSASTFAMRVEQLRKSRWWKELLLDITPLIAEAQARATARAMALGTGVGIGIAIYQDPNAVRKDLSNEIGRYQTLASYVDMILKQLDTVINCYSSPPERTLQQCSAEN